MKAARNINIAILFVLFASCILASNLRSLKNEQQLDHGVGQSQSLYSWNASTKINIQVTKRIKRNTVYYTQGFSFIGKNIVLESTGLNNQSEIHYINTDTMQISNSYRLPGQIFGEGSVMVRDQYTGYNSVYMLTWQNGVVYKFDEKLTRIMQAFYLPRDMKEGWGITKVDDSTLIATDGTNNLFHINPSNFSLKKKVPIYKKNGQPYNYLNECEMIEGLLYSNVYLYNEIIVADPNTGALLDVLNFEPLVRYLESEPTYYGKTQGTGECLNGIAYNSETRQMFVTGKNWPYIYEIKMNRLQ